MIILETFDGKNYEITEEQVTKIHELSLAGKVNGIWITNEYIAFPSIKGITETQSKPNYPELPAVGYTGIVKLADSLTKLERFVKGLKKTKAKLESQGLLTPHIDQYIQEARISYANLKAGRPNKRAERTYEPKYKTWEAAKAAGVV